MRDHQDGCCVNSVIVVRSCSPRVIQQANAIEPHRVKFRHVGDRRDSAIGITLHPGPVCETV